MLKSEFRVIEESDKNWSIQGNGASKEDSTIFIVTTDYNDDAIFITEGFDDAYMFFIGAVTAEKLK